MPRFHYTDLFSTYSIIARDPETGDLGGAVQTHQMSVGRLIPQALPGVGVVASQSLVNISFNNMALTMLKEQIAPQQIIDALIASDPGSARRQVAVLNNSGDVAAFSGEKCIREFGHYTGEGFSVQANMMTRTTVIDAMREAYESASGDLAARMLAALQAAQAEDGDIRGAQSAALLVVPGERTARDWESSYDVRVDEHATPVDELARLVRLRRAQHIDAKGHQLLTDGNTDEALAIWQEARDLAPELEEVAFWQAVTLADHLPDHIETAAAIYRESVADDARHAHWLDLINRLDECGLIERSEAARDLLQALES